MLQQKARHKWILERDSNSKYFHTVLKHRNRRNSILGINTNQGWVDNVDVVNEEIRGYFASRFQEIYFSRMLMDGVSFNILSVEEGEALEVHFSLDDVKVVI